MGPLHDEDSMLKRLMGFVDEECGTITADWVVLTGSAMILAVATIASVKTGTSALGPAISAEIDKSLP